MPHNDLALKAQTGVQKPCLTVAMCGLVEVHEVHVDIRPGEIAVELGMQMHEWFTQGGQAGDPHLGGGKSVHPHDQTGAGIRCTGLLAELADGVGCGKHGFVNDAGGQLAAGVERIDNLA